MLLALALASATAAATGPPRGAASLQAFGEESIVSLPGLSIRHARHGVHKAAPVADGGAASDLPTAATSASSPMESVEVEAPDASGGGLAAVFFQVSSEVDGSAAGRAQQPTESLEVSLEATGAVRGEQHAASPVLPGSFFQTGSESRSAEVPELGGGAEDYMEAAAASNASTRDGVAPAGLDDSGSGDVGFAATGAANHGGVAQAGLVRRETKQERGSTWQWVLDSVGAEMRRLALPSRSSPSVREVEAEIEVVTAPVVLLVLVVMTALACAKTARVAAMACLCGGAASASGKTPLAGGELAAQPRRQTSVGAFAEAQVLTAPTTASSVFVCGPTPRTEGGGGWGRGGGSSAAGGCLRGQVAALPLCSAADIARRLPASGSYDCCIPRPASSQRLLRFQARIEGPVSGAALVAPLTQQACVLFSASASRQLHDGVHPVTVAFQAAHVDFAVTLAEEPHTRVEVRGGEVSLFDVVSGRTEQVLPFPCAPDSWQDFVNAHRTTVVGAESTSAALRGDGAALEFQECALLVGSKVTLVGELLRGPTGNLSLQPLGQRRVSAELSRELCPVPDVGEEARFSKVVVSDDPLLLVVPSKHAPPGALAVEGPDLAK